METTEILSTLAQISIGLIGFTGVVTALDKEHSKLSEVDTYRLNVLIFPSISALFLSLLPLGLELMPWAESTIWLLVSLAQAIFSFAFVLWFVPASKAMMKIAPEIFSLKVWNVFLLGFIANIVLQTSSALKLNHIPPQATFVFGIYWWLLIGLLQFRRMLLIQRRRSKGD